MPDENFRAVAEATTACKVCGSPSALLGVVDFNKNCEIVRNRKVLNVCGIPVYYHQCTKCRYAFTTFTDSWSHADFHKHIYNEEYALVDPEYLDVRPRRGAEIMTKLYGGNKDVRMLDYGGGNGLTAKVLRETGFKNVEVYDPFNPEFATKPSGKFDLITVIEVLEHSPTPKETMAEISSLLSDVGVITLSMLVQPANMDAQGVNWWYLAPRNGHVSLFSLRSLADLVQPHGLTLRSFNEGFHLMNRGKPEFAKHLLG